MHGKYFEKKSQIQFIFQYSPSCNNTTIQKTLPFLLAFYRPTYAFDKNLLLLQRPQIREQEMVSWGSCVTNGAPVLR
jgi:hypothetical protein